MRQSMRWSVLRVVPAPLLLLALAPLASRAQGPARGGALIAGARAGRNNLDRHTSDG